MRRRSTGRTCPRTISPAPRRRSGCRCAPTSFYAENGIDLRLERDRRRHRRPRARSRARRRRDDSLRSSAAGDRRRAGPPVDSRRRAADVHVLRSLADCRAIIERAKTARRAVVLGASFIGLEVAAALARARTSRSTSSRRKSGRWSAFWAPRLGDFVRALHEEHGVVFHLRDTASGVEGGQVKLEGGRVARGRSRSSRASACVRASSSPRAAGLKVDRGVVVDAYLETSAPGIFAAGDIARWPDPHSRRGHPRRALGRGRAAGTGRGAQHARASARASTAVPFFWSQHYDVPINYVGHAEKWDELAVEGDIAAKDCLVRSGARDARSPSPRSSADAREPRGRGEPRARGGAHGSNLTVVASAYRRRF